jgi:hypothetical protein
MIRRPACHCKLASQPSPPRHSPEAQPIADGQGEAAWGTSGQVTQISQIVNKSLML